MRIKHKRLRELAEQDRVQYLPSELVPKLRRVLTVLNTARNSHQIDQLPGYHLHPLKGDLIGFWSISVSSNMRVVFRFEDDEVVDVDLTDYH